MVFAVLEAYVCGETLQMTLQASMQRKLIQGA